MKKLTKLSDSTVPIAIAITIALLIIVGIVLGTACKDKFANIFRKNVGLFENVSGADRKNLLFNKWKDGVSKKESLTIEEAKKRWNKLIDGHSNLFTKPIDQLNEKEKQYREMISNKIPEDEMKHFASKIGLNKV